MKIPRNEHLKRRPLGSPELALSTPLCEFCGKWMPLSSALEQFGQFWCARIKNVEDTPLADCQDGRVKPQRAAVNVGLISGHRGGAKLGQYRQGP
jgi:hypothetical protein